MPRIGEEQGGVVVRDHRRRGHCARTDNISPIAPGKPGQRRRGSSVPIVWPLVSKKSKKVRRTFWPVHSSGAILESVEAEASLVCLTAAVVGHVVQALRSFGRAAVRKRAAGVVAVVVVAVVAVVVVSRRFSRGRCGGAVESTRMTQGLYITAGAGGSGAVRPTTQPHPHPHPPHAWFNRRRSLPDAISRIRSASAPVTLPDWAGRLRIPLAVIRRGRDGEERFGGGARLAGENDAGVLWSAAGGHAHAR